ncbi:MAG TPA: hypothetical protein PLR66_15035 [Planctomycetota bacterium]|nr:MAG: Beta-galactosidase trimerization domain protein [Planctomycetes bacterium ADurb.Bin069]HQF67155.1 hypothetical protein [Planctomycetota bacterium]
MTRRSLGAATALLAALLLSARAPAAEGGGVFLRFRLLEPPDAAWFVKLGGYIHNDPWYLPEAVWPAGADTDPAARLRSGEASPWFDLQAHAGARLHGRLRRAGGCAEFPNVTACFACAPESPGRRVVIELATAPDEAQIVKRFEEEYTGALTSFLVSPHLRADAPDLENASQMTARRLAWAREAAGGRRAAPERLWIQTQFWAPQRPELNVKEAEVLWLLGFNLVGNLTEEMRAQFPFLEPGGHHWVEFGPALTRADIEDRIAEPARKARPGPRPTLFGFSDEIVCRPPIGGDARALAHFRAWLAEQGWAAADLGAATLAEVAPIESPAALRARRARIGAAADRLFALTTRFRQQSATERLRWLTESFRRHAPPGVLTTTLVADHPYFGGSGLGMGMDRENTTWGGFPLALDWFSLGRERAVDVIGIEDWLGLGFMFGPGATWEGFQLLGFQAAIFRSASRGALPIMAWITPSDETNLRLKSASALCQGAKHFFYWTYGPTATSTENYWSDLRGAYDGVAAVARRLAGAERIIAPGRPRATRVALLYTLASDLWQPFGYLHMAERRLTYFALIHEQYLVDLLAERDIEDGRLRDYDALYVADPCVPAGVCARIRAWVREGGRLYGSTAAASRDEYNAAHDGLADVFGIAARVEVQVQPGRFDVRGGLNDLPWLDRVSFPAGGGDFGALGMKAKAAAAGAAVTGVFADGAPAVFAHRAGKGAALYVATCPALSYAKDAGFVPAELKEKWPAAQRGFLTAVARESGAPRLVELSHPVVEAGVFESARGAALILANFTYEPIARLEIRMPLKAPPARVVSLEHGPLPFAAEASGAALAAAGYGLTARCAVALGLDDIVLFE